MRSAVFIIVWIIIMFGIRDSSCWISSARRIIQAIGEHVIAQQALPSRNESIRIEESAQLRIVISGPEVIQASI